MAPTVEMTTEELLAAVGDVNINENVRAELGIYGQNPNLKTWMDVHNLIGRVATELKAGALERLGQQIRDAVQAKRVEDALNKVQMAASKLLSSATSYEPEDIAEKIVAGFVAYEATIKKEEGVESKDEGGVEGLEAEAPAVINTPTPHDNAVTPSRGIAAGPSRDWRDARGNDPGYATRQQYLNPPTDPWDEVE